MINKQKRHGLTIMLLVLGAAFLWIGCGASDSTSSSTSSGTESDSQQDASQKWTCAMHPNIVMDQPGDCPICGMKLEPMDGGSDDDSSSEEVRLTMTDRAKTMAEVKTAPVERRFVSTNVRLYGQVTVDETRTETITAWVSGRLDRMHVNFTGRRVRKGEPMVRLWSPDIQVTQNDLIQARQNLENASSDSARERARNTVQSIRRRLANWGLTKKQIDSIAEKQEPDRHITLKAPASGVVLTKHREEGEYVETGTSLYTIADLSEVWLELEAYEKDLTWIRYGQEVTIQAESFPGETLEGQVSFVTPTVNPKTRTAKVRVELQNPDGKMKPGMYATGIIRSTLSSDGNVVRAGWEGKRICPTHPDVVSAERTTCPRCSRDLLPPEEFGYAKMENSRPPLVIPATAPLITGKRAVVYVEVPDSENPTYEGREIQLGPEAGRYYIVQSGLEEGEQVVVNGNFNIDSELQIKAQPSMMYGNGEETDDTNPSSETGEASDSDTSRTRMPSSFRRNLVPLIDAYFQIQSALARDQYEETRQQIRSLLDELNSFSADDLSESNLNRWSRVKEVLKESAETINNTGEPGKIREEYRALSEALYQFLQTAGPIPDRDIHVFHCPMAFDEEGATWLQSEDSLTNPYFEDQMKSCGDKRGVIR